MGSGSPALYAAFLVAGMVMGVTQHLYYERLARDGGSAMRPAVEIGDEIRRHPSRLFAVVSVETRLHVRALLTHQPDARLERLRLIALGSLSVAAALFFILGWVGA